MVTRAIKVKLRNSRNLSKNMEKYWYGTILL